MDAADVTAFPVVRVAAIQATPVILEAVLEPASGAVIAGPLYDQEGIVEAECDLRVGLDAKRWFDSVGHYSREDALARELVVPREPA